MTKQPVIGVFGCGPSGLIAAQTARALGARVHVFSRPVPSYIAGAQYLHAPVPEMTSPDPDGYITVRKQGTRDGYAEKVYGYPQAPVSWDRYENKVYPAWNMRKLYELLWRAWEPFVLPLDLTPAIAAQAATTGVVGGATEDGWGGIAVDAVVSTVPLRALCKATHAPTPHAFLEQEVFIRQIEDSQGISSLGENHIIYNGEREPAWYRMSFIFGCEAFEYSASSVRSAPPVEGITKIYKPLATDCTCFEETRLPWLRVGRYGAWHKDSLVHDVPNKVANLMDVLGANV